MSNFVVSLFVVKNSEDKYLSGFDTVRGKAIFVDNPIAAKKFTNKHDIKLRPDESLIELTVDLSTTAVAISEPFRPSRRSIKTRI